MIPKIIHYCWLSGDPYPEKIQNCINSWEKLKSDYQFVLWDWKKCQDEGIINYWVQEAFEKKKYAFASDYIRLYAIYKYGGIYLDTDVEIIKTFDPLLHLPYFIGREAKGNRVEIAAFGAEKGCPWINLCLNYYNNRHFIKKEGSYDMKVMPDIIHEIMCKHYQYQYITNIHSFVKDNKVFNQFPNDWFCANIYVNSEDIKPSYAITENTFCIHHFANTWIRKNKLKEFVKALLIKTKLIKILLYVKN